MKTKQWLLEIIVFLLAGLYFYTAVSKLIDFKRFTWQINNQPFDNQLTTLLTYVLPAIELLITVLLLWPKTTLKGLYGSAVLMTVFTSYIALVTFNFYDRVPCACATAFEYLSWPQHLVLNFVFLLLSLFGTYLKRKQPIG